MLSEEKFLPFESVLAEHHMPLPTCRSFEHCFGAESEVAVWTGVCLSGDNTQTSKLKRQRAIGFVRQPRRTNQDLNVSSQEQVTNLN